MKNLKPLLLVVFIAAAVAIVGYAYVVFGERYGFKQAADNGNTNTNNNNSSSIIDDFSNLLGGNNENDNANLNANENLNQNANTNGNTNVNAPTREEINKKDCDNNCTRYRDNEENFKYCQQVCGYISPSEKESENDCADLTGLEKDYCWRDLAVSKLDKSICAKISDKKLQSVCRNRIAEELLN